MKKILFTTIAFLFLILVSACGGNFLSFRTYEVSFVTNGGSEIAPISVEIGLPIDFSSHTSTYDGYKLEGWYLDAKFSQLITDEFLVFQNLTVYAKWELDYIALPDILYEVNESILTWDYDANTYNLFIEGELIDELNTNMIDLANYKELINNNTKLLITTINNDDNNTYALLDLVVKYESNSILLYNKFQTSEGFNPVMQEADIDYLVNNWTIRNSNFIRDEGILALKLIYNKENIKDSQAVLLFDNNQLANFYQVTINAKTQSLNKIKVIIETKNTNERYEEIIELSPKYMEYIIEPNNIFQDSEIKISIILLPSSLKTENSGVYIKDLSLLSNSEQYIITENNN